MGVHQENDDFDRWSSITISRSFKFNWKLIALPSSAITAGYQSIIFVSTIVGSTQNYIFNQNQLRKFGKNNHLDAYLENRNRNEIIKPFSASFTQSILILLLLLFNKVSKKDKDEAFIHFHLTVWWITTIKLKIQ